jgi:hypothetical protein
MKRIDLLRQLARWLGLARRPSSQLCRLQAGPLPVRVDAARGASPIAARVLRP